MSENSPPPARPWLLRMIVVRPRLSSCAAIGVATQLFPVGRAAEVLNGKSLAFAKGFDRLSPNTTGRLALSPADK